MSTIFRPSLTSNFDYRGTFFADLAVSVYEPKHDEIEQLMDVAFGGTSPVAAVRLPPMVYKSYQFADRRYNSINRHWTLDELLQKLEVAASFGPVSEKNVEKHASFTIEHERPEDKYLKVNVFGVCLNEWAFEPIYHIGQFDSLAPAISAMREIQAYLSGQES